MRLVLLLSLLFGCGAPSTVDAPPGGWANRAPTTVEDVVDRGAHQLLQVRQEGLVAWVQVPDLGAVVGDHILLGQGTARSHVPIPERETRADLVVEIDHAQIVDAETAARLTTRPPPKGALPIGEAYAQLQARAGSEVLVYGRVARAPRAVGSTWVHLQDGTGDAAAGTHDLTVKTSETVLEGEWVAFRGMLRSDVDLGFGYHYDALVEDGQRVD
jgi:hypothetical protein